MPAPVDMRVLGSRIRELRVARGLSQGDVAGDALSVSYISRIEAGQRRPERRSLVLIAARLGTTVDHLLTGVRRDEMEELRLSLKYADLALNSGDPTAAEQGFRDVLSSLAERPVEQLVDEATWGHARALEALGRLEEAAAALEHLRERTPDVHLWLRATIALCRCYREAGDLTRAVEVGELSRVRLSELGLAGSNDGVKLAVTLAAAYYERGDETRALMLVEDALRAAEAINSPSARAAAYWNASAMMSDRGRLPEALSLAERALALLSEGDDERNLARLRVEYGSLLLRVSPPQPERAVAELERAQAGLEQRGGTAVDLAYCYEQLGRASLLLGQPETAQHHAAAALQLLGDKPRLERASIHALRGLAALLGDDRRTAKRHYQQAAADLTGVAAGRSAGQLWAELGAALEVLGDTAGARDAYRAAVACLGIVAGPTPSVVPASGSRQQ